MEPMTGYHGSPSEGESWEEWAEHSFTHDDVSGMCHADAILGDLWMNDTPRIVAYLSKSKGE